MSQPQEVKSFSRPEYFSFNQARNVINGVVSKENRRLRRLNASITIPPLNVNVINPPPGPIHLGGVMPAPPANPDPLVTNKWTRLLVTVYTGCQTDAGTSHYVSMEVLGANGQGQQVANGAIDLNTWGASFWEAHRLLTKSSQDKFTLTSGHGLDSSELQSIVGVQFTVHPSALHLFDDDGSWFVKKVEIVPVCDTSNLKGTPIVIPCFQWIDPGCTAAFARAYSDNTPIPAWVEDIILLHKRMLYPGIENEAYMPGHFPKREDFTRHSVLSLASKSYSSLPSDAAFESSKQSNFIAATAHTLAGSGLSVFLSFFDSWDNIGEMERLVRVANLDGVPAVKNTWMTDDDFGRQTLEGINPTRIEFVPPAGSPLSTKSSQQADRLMSLLLSNALFPAESKAVIQYCNTARSKGQLFVLDFSEFLELNTHFDPRDPKRSLGNGDAKGNNRKFLVWPTCLLVNHPGHNTLKPLVIRLNYNSDVNDASDIWFPPVALDASGQLSDSHFQPSPTNLPSSPESWRWLLARTFVANADTCYHQVLVHFLGTHACLEPFALAMERELPSNHALFRLMKRHTKYTMAINALARDTLINPGGIIESIFSSGDHFQQILQAGTFKWRLKDMNPIENLCLRGMGSVDAGGNFVPKNLDVGRYRWRDDGILVWNAIVDYVKLFLEAYYDSDDDIRNDPYLQRFVDAVNKSFPRGGSAELPVEPIDTLEKLYKFVATIIWIASARHASVNFGQYEYYAFVPNRPAGLYRQPSAIYAVNDEKDFVNFLPNKSASVSQIGVVYTLSRYADLEEYLLGGTVPPGSEPYENLDQAALLAAFHFHEQLREVDQQIYELNRKHAADTAGFYLWMKPSKIPNSIAI